jgi:predicted DNA-binding transcriptional regulator AlpA
MLNKHALRQQKGVRLSDVSLWRMERDNRFPKHIKIGQCKFWFESEIDAYLERLGAKRGRVVEVA